MLRKLPKISNIKKVFFLIVLILIFQPPSLTDDIQNFRVEEMSIGDGALDYARKI